MFSAPFQARFFTLTFPESNAPSEQQAQRCMRSLVSRLRYRGLLGDYGWVLQRQQNGTLHFHGIAEMCWMDDKLKLWGELIVKSDFGIQNSLEVARPSHAAYCARYISRNLADLAPLRRAYGFTKNFPRAPEKDPGEKVPDASEDVLREILHPDELAWMDEPCDWISEAELRNLLQD
jgi:hypothetical protein